MTRSGQMFIDIAGNIFSFDPNGVEGEDRRSFYYKHLTLSGHTSKSHVQYLNHCNLLNTAEVYKWHFNCTSGLLIFIHLLDSVQKM